MTEIHRNEAVTGVSEKNSRSRDLPLSPPDPPTASCQPIPFILNILGDGPMSSLQIIHEARLLGIRDRTLHEARLDLGVIVEKERRYRGRWMWRLPDIRRFVEGPNRELGERITPRSESCD